MQKLYVAGDSVDGPLKIGIAGNPQQRLIDLQVGNPLKLHLFLVWETRNPRMLERSVHYQLRGKRLVGEWFNLALGEVYSTISGDCGLNVLRSLVFDPTGQGATANRLPCVTSSGFDATEYETTLLEYARQT